MVKLIKLLPLLLLTLKLSHTLSCSGESIDYCIKCKSGTNTCETCTEGRTGNGCSLCQDNCQDCEDKDNCKNCKPNFFKEKNSDNKYICSACSEECYDCESSTICRTCKVGYYQSATDATCKKCNEMCKTCSTGIICDECKTGYFLDFSVSSACRLCEIDGCDACTGRDSCTRCKESWFLHEGKCYDINGWNKFRGLRVVFMVWILMFGFFMA